MEHQEEKQSENKKDVSITKQMVKQALKGTNVLSTKEINSTSNNRR